MGVGKRLVGGAVLACTLAACTPPVATPPTAAPLESPPAADLARFYGQQLEWTDCDGAECATLEVPVDYADPEGPTLGIAVLRSPSTGDARGALVVNPGGPGSSGVDYLASTLGRPIFPDLWAIRSQL